MIFLLFSFFFFPSGLMFRVSVILISFHWQNKYCSICALLQSATEGLKHLSSGCQVVCKGTGKQLILHISPFRRRLWEQFSSVLPIIPKLCQNFVPFFNRIYLIMIMNNKIKGFHALWQLKAFFFYKSTKMFYKGNIYYQILRVGQMN